ncbi:HemK2/MTQ2 family protein methyltransferase [Nocardia sp. NPDC127579]|uniref:HemK2/MTQ2 family protein methyltransferase n=1 Tax=Nocardia sp. NPDC127579 TaxID=3345402 RepID=UPI00363C7644
MIISHPPAVTRERGPAAHYLLRCPGVYRPQHDTWLLAHALARTDLAPRPEVLDIGTGTGAVAIAAARIGAAAVTAVDVSRAALASAWLNSRLRRIPIEFVHGDFASALRGRRFDLVLANPPYVPCPATERSSRACRTWNGGPDGRVVLDELCAALPRLLAPGGVGLLVQSALAGSAATLDLLAQHGFEARVVACARVPFGPVLRRHAGWLEHTGRIRPGERHEDLIVIRANRATD